MALTTLRALVELMDYYGLCANCGGGGSEKPEGVTRYYNHYNFHTPGLMSTTQANWTDTQAPDSSGFIIHTGVIEGT